MRREVADASDPTRTWSGTAGDTASAPLSWERAVASLRADPAHSKLVQDAYFDLPVVGAARRYAASAEWVTARGFFPSVGTALDLGAGNGIASYALAHDGWKVFALEPDPSNEVGAGAIRAIAESEKLPIRVLSGFGESIPLQNASVNLVFARQVLHHARDLPQLCRELARVLKPGGTLVTVRDHVISKRADINAFLAAHPAHHMYGGENAFLLREYVDALQGAGLRIRRALRSFDSVLNYAPHTLESLRSELIHRLRAMPAGSAAAYSLRSSSMFTVARKILSLIDRRPGRLVSFICFKPQAGDR